MLYFVIDYPSIAEGICVRMATENHAAALEHAARLDYYVIDRNSIKSQLQAATLASACNGDLRDSSWSSPNQYVWVDQGNHHYPRYDVVRAPQVGDEVSYGFNGDYYPCGKVTRVSDFKALGNGVSCRRVEAQEENGSVHVFWRAGNTSSWKKDRTWSLVRGHRNERNPCF